MVNENINSNSEGDSKRFSDISVDITPSHTSMDASHLNLSDLPYQEKLEYSRYEKMMSPKRHSNEMSSEALEEKFRRMMHAYREQMQGQAAKIDELQKEVERISKLTPEKGNGGVSNGGVSNGGVSNGGVSNGGVSNGGVSNGDEWMGKEVVRESKQEDEMDVEIFMEGDDALDDSFQKDENKPNKQPDQDKQTDKPDKQTDQNRQTDQPDQNRQTDQPDQNRQTDQPTKQMNEYNEDIPPQDVDIWKNIHAKLEQNGFPSIEHGANIAKVFWRVLNSFEKNEALKNEVSELEKRLVDITESKGFQDIYHKIEQYDVLVKAKDEIIDGLKEKLEQLLHREQLTRKNTKATFEQIIGREPQNKTDKSILSMMALYEQQKKKLQDEIHRLREQSSKYSKDSSKDPSNDASNDPSNDASNDPSNDQNKSQEELKAHIDLLERQIRMEKNRYQTLESEYVRITRNQEREIDRLKRDLEGTPYASSRDTVTVVIPPNRSTLHNRVNKIFGIDATTEAELCNELEKYSIVLRSVPKMQRYIAEQLKNRNK